VSGPLGGSRAEFEYVGDVRALYDLLMRRSSQARSPMSPRFPLPQNDIVATITQNPSGVRNLVSTRRNGGFPVAGNSVRAGHIGRVHARLPLVWNRRRDGSHARQSSPTTTTTRSYVSDVVPAPVLGADQRRHCALTSTPDAANFMRLHYDPSGVLTRPLLTIHASATHWCRGATRAAARQGDGPPDTSAIFHSRTMSVSATRKRSPGPRWVPRSTRWWPGPTRESSRRARCRSVPSLDASDTADSEGLRVAEAPVRAPAHDRRPSTYASRAASFTGAERGSSDWPSPTLVFVGLPSGLRWRRDGGGDDPEDPAP